MLVVFFMAKKIIISLVVEFSPVIVFFISSSFLNFTLATGIFVIVTILVLILGYLEYRRLAWFPLIVALSVVSFGGLTVVFHNPFFIIFKDTIYNGIFALVLYVGILFGRGLLKLIFHNLFVMSERGWYILSLRWAIFFTILAVSNEYTRYILEPNDWIIFKGLATISTMVFAVYQFRLAKKERLPGSNAWGMRI
jgi:intracellular septation protein